MNTTSAILATMFVVATLAGAARAQEVSVESLPPSVILPAGIQKERDRLLAAADAKVRDGVRNKKLVAEALAPLHELEKRVGNDHRPVDLADAAAKLTAAIGGEWRVAKRERAPGLGQELWCSLSSWHGVHVPYVVLPFPSPDDEGRAKLNAFFRECSAALEVIASDDQGCAWPDIDHAGA